MMDKGQKISIVSVVRNPGNIFEKTILSVINQDYPDIEYIVIDGGSGDETIGLITKYKDRIDYFIREPDLGIYDAMNKGLKMAQGQWINFMNAGDTFYNIHTLSDIFTKNVRGLDVIYGDSIAEYQDFKVYTKAKPIDQIWKGMIICHQSVFVRAGIPGNQGFNLNYKIGADYDMMYRLFSEGKKFLYIPEPFSVFDSYGISNRLMVKSAREHYTILKTYKKVTFKEKLYHQSFIGYLGIIKTCYALLPNDLIHKTIKFIKRNQSVYTE